jgi:hypothetical protein
MSDDLDDDFDEDFEEELPDYPRDVEIDRAKSLVVKFFDENPKEVFYEQQLKCLLERKPESVFQWITSKALGELRQEGAIKTELVQYQSGSRTETIRFFWNKKNRYPQRKKKTIMRLVAVFSHPDFGKALGLQGELLVDNALMGAGFGVRAAECDEWAGRRWKQSGENLDRIYERDGVLYGAEIKNTLKYIGKQELESKIRMCEAFGVRPLFATRSLPKHYVNIIREAGGFGWILGKQYYPFGQDAFADEVRRILKLEVGCHKAIDRGRVKSFVNWHEWSLSREFDRNSHVWVPK